MIENATIYVWGKPFLTRLHEHGKEPVRDEDLYNRDNWLYTGYMEGKEETLKALKTSGLTSLEFHREDEIIVLSGIVWGAVDNMYDDHFILHLDWSKETSNHSSSLRGKED
jgi:hypothetical protein